MEMISLKTAADIFQPTSSTKSNKINLEFALFLSCLSKELKAGIIEKNLNKKLS